MITSGCGMRTKRANRMVPVGWGAGAGLVCHSRLSLDTMAALSRKSVGILSRLSASLEPRALISLSFFLSFFSFLRACAPLPYRIVFGSLGGIPLGPWRAGACLLSRIPAPGFWTPSLMVAFWTLYHTAINGYLRARIFFFWFDLGNASYPFGWTFCLFLQ